MGNIERGTDIPSLETFIKIANALLVDANTLMNEELTIYTPPAQTDKISLMINNKLNSMDTDQKRYFLKVISDFDAFCTAQTSH